MSLSLNGSNTIQWSSHFTNTPWTRLVQEYCRRQNMSLALELAFRLIFLIVQNFAGALMGAIHGYTEIPLEWRVELQDYEVQFLWRLFFFLAKLHSIDFCDRSYSKRSLILLLNWWDFWFCIENRCCFRGSSPSGNANEVTRIWTLKPGIFICMPSRLRNGHESCFWQNR